MTHTPDTLPSKPRLNPWPVAIIAYFIVFTAGIVAYIIFSLGQRMDLVRHDYYDEEIRYQEQINRLGRTGTFATELAATYDSTQAAIAVTIPGSHAQAARGTIRLYRPADARLDRELPLTVDAQGRQRVDARNLASGLWKVRVQWNVAGEEYFFDRTLVIGDNRI